MVSQGTKKKKEILTSTARLHLEELNLRLQLLDPPLSVLRRVVMALRHKSLLTMILRTRSSSSSSSSWRHTRKHADKRSSFGRSRSGSGSGSRHNGVVGQCYFIVIMAERERGNERVRTTETDALLRVFILSR